MTLRPVARLHERMRAEGHEAPAVVPIFGLDNGPVARIACLNEALAWLATVRDAHSSMAFLPSGGGGGSGARGGGGAVALIFDGAGSHSPENFSASGFALAMMSSQLQANPQLARRGYWSWMDGPGGPGTAGDEVTVTPAYFGNCPPHGAGMWTGADAVGRRGGYTFYLQVAAAMAAKPKVLLVSQWNEFAGQDNGGGYGTDKMCFGDSYSRDLSNDIEPTSLESSDCYVRPNSTCLGWGMFGVNLLRALLHGGLAQNETLLFITSPKWMANVAVGEYAIE
jgi:hypothetical protein